MSFYNELDAAFSSFANEAGTTITFKQAKPAQAFIHTPNPYTTKVDMGLGRPYVVHVDVRRAEAAAKWGTVGVPKVGDSFTDAARVTYTVSDIDRTDITDPVMVFICKTTGVPAP